MEDEITSQETLLARIYNVLTFDSKSDLPTRAVRGAARLARKALHWNKKAVLHEDGIHRLLIRLGAADNISDATRYLTKLTYKCADNILLKVSRSGGNAFQFEMVPY